MKRASYAQKNVMHQLQLDVSLCRMALAALLESLSKKTAIYKPDEHCGVNIALLPASPGELQELKVGDFPTDDRKKATKRNALEKATRVSEQRVMTSPAISSYSERDPKNSKWGGGLLYLQGKISGLDESFSLAPSGLPEIWDEIYGLALVQLHLPELDILGYYTHNIGPDKDRGGVNSAWVLQEARKIIDRVALP